MKLIGLSKSFVQNLRLLMSTVLVVIVVVQTAQALKKYFQKDRTTTFSTIPGESQELPVLTVCSRKVFKDRPGYLNKKESSSLFHLNLFEQQFDDWPTEDVPQIWNASTAIFSNLVHKVEVSAKLGKHELRTQESQSDQSFIQIIPINSPFFGRCYTLTIKENLTLEGYLHLDFWKETIPNIYIHLPGQELGVIGNEWESSVDFVRVKKGTQMNIYLSKQIKIDDPAHVLCDSKSNSTNHAACIKNYVDRQIQNRTFMPCKIPQLDYFDFGNFTKWCNDKKMAYYVFSKVMDLMREAKGNQSICQKPCRTMTFSSRKMDFGFHSKDDRSRLRLSLTTTDSLVQEEYRLFDSGELIASFGGSVGLFLGISCMDVVNKATKWLRKIMMSSMKEIQ